MSEKMSPRPNQEIVGLPAKPLVDVVSSANSLAGIRHKHFLPIGVYRPTLQTAVDIWPLVEDVQRGKSVTPEDVRPYADDIIDNIVTNPVVSDAAARRGDYATARKLGWLSRLRDVQLVRDRIRPEVEARFPEHVRNFLQSDEIKQRLEHGLEAAKPYAEVIASYENPREQFVAELSAVNDEIREQAEMARDARLQAEYARRPAHTLRGRLLHWRHQNKTPDQLTKPIDVAQGIDHALIKALDENSEATQIPMLKNIIETALAETGRTSADVMPPQSVRKFGATIPRTQILEAAAPEIMQSLTAPLPAKQRSDPLLKSAKKHFSFKAKLGRLFKGFDVDVLRRRGPRLLTGIRDVLPTKGQKITQAMDDIRELFLTP